VPLERIESERDVFEKLEQADLRARVIFRDEVASALDELRSINSELIVAARARMRYAKAHRGAVDKAAMLEAPPEVDSASLRRPDAVVPDAALSDAPSGVIVISQKCCLGSDTTECSPCLATASWKAWKTRVLSSTGECSWRGSTVDKRSLVTTAGLRGGTWWWRLVPVMVDPCRSGEWLVQSRKPPA